MRARAWDWWCGAVIKDGERRTRSHSPQQKYWQLRYSLKGTTPWFLAGVYVCLLILGLGVVAGFSWEPKWLTAVGLGFDLLGVIAIAFPFGMLMIRRLNRSTVRLHRRDRKVVKVTDRELANRKRRVRERWRDYRGAVRQDLVDLVPFIIKEMEEGNEKDTLKDRLNENILRWYDRVSKNIEDAERDLDAIEKARVPAEQETLYWLIFGTSLLALGFLFQSWGVLK